MYGSINLEVLLKMELNNKEPLKECNYNFLVCNISRLSQLPPYPLSKKAGDTQSTHMQHVCGWCMLQPDLPLLRDATQ